MEPSSADYSPPSASAPPCPGPTPDYKDRSTGLIVFGIIEILGGFLCALGIPFMLLSLALGRRAGGAMPVGSIVMIVVTYAALAAILITLGIGSTMAKRWAGALNLILSWIWVILGIMVTVIIIAVMPSAFLTAMRTAAQRDPNAGSAPPGLMAVILTFMIVMMAIFLVVVPLVFLLFYRSRNVAETVRHRDPVERWTDRVPLPVLAFSLMAACGAAYYLLVGVTTPLFPFFGRYLTGNPGRAGIRPVRRTQCLHRNFVFPLEGERMVGRGHLRCFSRRLSSDHLPACGFDGSVCADGMVAQTTRTDAKQSHAAAGKHYVVEPAGDGCVYRILSLVEALFSCRAAAGNYNS